jgi:hypothetical protein
MLADHLDSCHVNEPILSSHSTAAGRSARGLIALVRMLETRGREDDRLALESMQRVLELDRGLSWERWVAR